MRFRTPLLTAVAVFLAVDTAAAVAQVRGFQLTLDNDAYDFWIPPSVRPDYEYTNGIRLAVDVEGAPGWGRLARVLAPCADGRAVADAEAGCATTTFEFGQRLYSPRVDSEEPLPGQRPYAGWLYLAATGHAVRGSVRHTVAAEVGVTGEPSLGRAVMERYHRIVGFWRPVGWRHQLDFEPGIVARYGLERRMLELRAGDRRAFDLVADGGASLGTVHTGVRAGVRARAGYRLPHPFAARKVAGTAVYVMGGVGGEGVARNLFLDGNTFGGDTARVHREPWIATVSWGVGVARGRFGAEYRVTTRTQEYREEPGGHPVATMELTWRP